MCSISSLPPNVEEINALIDQSDSYALNEDGSHHFGNLLISDPGMILRSDADEQMIIQFSFRSSVKVHSIGFRSGDMESAPTVVRVFSDRKNLDFSDVEDYSPTQVLELSPSDYEEGNVTNLKFVKFQRLNSITLMIDENGGCDFSSLSEVVFFGCSLEEVDVSGIHKLKK